MLLGFAWFCLVSTVGFGRFWSVSRMIYWCTLVYFGVFSDAFINTSAISAFLSIYTSANLNIFQVF